MFRRCAVLCAYNKSSGYRWSAIPKPPPRGVDRLYGTHSVLSALRVFAQSAHDTTSGPQASSLSSSSSTAPSTSNASQSAHGKQPGAHRETLYRLYVRDFSLDESQSDPSRAKAHATESDDKTSQKQQQQGRHKKVIPARYSTLHRIVALAKVMKVPVQFVPRNELVQLCGERRNQHVVLEASSFTPTPIHTLADLIRRGDDKDDADAVVGVVGRQKRRVVLFLDHIVDPTNVGNILRTAYFNGVDDLILSADSASCTPAVARTSTGFLEYMHVFQATSDTPDFLRRSRRDLEAQQQQTQQHTINSTTGEPVRLDIIATTTSERAKAVAATVAPTTTAATPSLPREGGCRHIQVLLLGNEDRGLSDAVVQASTHTMHVRSLRQELLQDVGRKTKLVATNDPEEERDALADESAEANGRVQAASDYAVRRLWRLRPQEVTLNVNAACSAMLCLLTSENYSAHLHPICTATTTAAAAAISEEESCERSNETNMGE